MQAQGLGDHNHMRCNVEYTHGLTGWKEEQKGQSVIHQKEHGRRERGTWGSNIFEIQSDLPYQKNHFVSDL